MYAFIGLGNGLSHARCQVIVSASENAYLVDASLLTKFIYNFMWTFSFVLSMIIEMFPGISELMNL